MYKLTE